MTDNRVASRVAQALSELDGGLIEAFINEENHIEERRKLEVKNRAALLAVCAAVAGGAYFALRTGGGPTVVPGESVPSASTLGGTATDEIPAATVSPKTGLEVDTQSKTNSEPAGVQPEAVYAGEGRTLQRSFLTSDEPFDPACADFNTVDGTVVVTDALKAQIAQNPGSDKLFCVVINAYSGHYSALGESLIDSLISDYVGQHADFFERCEKHSAESSHVIENLPTGRDSFGKDIGSSDEDCPECRRLISEAHALLNGMREMIEEHSGFADMAACAEAEKLFSSSPAVFGGVKKLPVVLLDSDGGEEVRTEYKNSYVAYMKAADIERLWSGFSGMTPASRVLALQIDIMPAPPENEWGPLYEPPVY